MQALVPQKYFPLPLVQAALYNLTPQLHAEIGSPTPGFIPVLLRPAANLSDSDPGALLFRELTAAAVRHQAWQDHQPMRDLFYQAAFSREEQAERLLPLLTQQVTMQATPPEARPLDSVSPMIERPRAVVDRAAGTAEMTINTDECPWPLVLRATSRVMGIAATTILASDSPVVTVHLRSEMNPTELADWFLAELERAGRGAPALYPPAFTLSETMSAPPASPRPEAAPGELEQAPAAAGDWTVLHVPASVYPESAVSMALLALSADFEGECTGENEERLVRLRPKGLGLTDAQVASALHRELLIAAVHERTREEGVSLVNHLASSARSVSTAFQSLVQSERYSLRCEEDTSPNVDPVEPRSTATIAGCRTIFRDEALGRARFDVNPQRYPLPALLHLIHALRPHAQISVVPKKDVHEVYLSARVAADFPEVERRFLAELQQGDIRQ